MRFKVYQQGDTNMTLLASFRNLEDAQAYLDAHASLDMIVVDGEVLLVKNAGKRTQDVNAA